MIKVFLYDVIPSQNKGEMAILVGIKEILNGLGKHALTMISQTRHYSSDVENYSSLVDKIIHFDTTSKIKMKIVKIWLYILMFLSIPMMKLFGRKLKSSSEFISAVLECDLLLFGHDNIIAKGGFSPSICLLSYLCRWLQIPVFFCMGSIGPFDNPLKLYIAKKTINNFNEISLRDKPSYDFVKSLGVEMDHVYLSIDPAFLMKPASQAVMAPIFDSIGIPEDQGKVLGISLTHFVLDQAFIEIADIDLRKNRFYKEFSSVLETFCCNHPDVKVLFIPHGFGPSKIQDDRVYIHELMEFLPSRIVNQVITFDHEFNAQELKSIIGRCDLFIGMRTHAIIASLSTGTPLVALSTNGRNKTNGIVGDFFGLHDYIYYCEQFDKDDLSELVEMGWDIKEQTKKIVMEKSLNANEIALGNVEYIKKCIGSKKS